MRASRLSGDDGERLLVQPELDGGKTCLLARVDKGVFEHRQERLGDTRMHEADLLRVADRRAARLGVYDDGEGFFQIRVLVHIHVADAGSRFDAGNGCMLDTSADEACAASRDEKVDKTGSLHDFRRAMAGGILDDVHDIRVKARRADAVFERVYDRLCRAVRLFSGAEHADVAAFEAERGRVRGDIRAALIDDGDEAQRHLLFIDFQPVWARDFIQNPSRVVGKGGRVPNPGGHGLDASGAETEPVEHDLGNCAPCLLHVLRVREKNFVCVVHEVLGHGQKQPVLVFCACTSDRGPCGFCFL